MQKSSSFKRFPSCSGSIGESAGNVKVHELPGGTKDDILRLLPGTGETVAFIAASAECAIGEKVPLIGKLTLKDCEDLAFSSSGQTLSRSWSINRIVDDQQHG
jgi:hypothetical protein